MSGISQDPPPVADANPFSLTTIAHEHDFVRDVVTIETDSLRRALGYVSEYLTATTMGVENARPVDAGNVIAIVGDHGTGKTHLVMQLLRRARTAPEATVYATYLDATADTFLALYRRFIQKIGLSEVRAWVSEYYADVIAESLQESDLTIDVARSLRDRRVAPEHVVERLNLMESELLPKVQQELKEVSNNDVFGIAFTLLLRPGFDESVWSWLTGGPPEQVLVERGITNTIDTEVAALEALGIFALLHGRQRRRFLLVIDELEKVLSASAQPTAEASVALRKLLDTFSAAGAFLVLSGLPNFLQLLRSDVRQRISHVITMSGLSPDETLRFIEKSQQRVFNESRLEPFTRDTVAYLVRLTGGTARTVIRLCGHLYRRATDAGSLVTDELVREVAREHFATMSNDMMHGEIQRRLRTCQWAYHRNRLLGPAPDSLVDYWVSVSDHGAGCAVLLTCSVLESGDVEELTHRAAVVRRSVPDSDVLLVVNGILPDELATQLSGTFSTDPVVYDTWSFADDFDTALAVSARRLERVDSKRLAAIWDRVDEVKRQQSRIYHSVEQLGVRVDDLSSLSLREFIAIRGQLGELFDIVSWVNSLKAREATDE